ncbi:metallophosphoesterase [Candidatus Micrarchaeota archaeon]|nr:metallophosphoesterase [Candidatus Micrarchaeota archaeon]
MKFVAGRPAMVLGKYLVLAELHLGIEYELRKKGVRMPLLENKIAEEINELLKETKTHSLIVLGDAKHDIYGMREKEKRMMHRFFSQLHCKRIILVKGNHDGDLDELAGKYGKKEVKVVPAEGFVLKVGGKTYGLVHGHAWPKKEVFESDFLLMAHNHPLVEFSSKGYKRAEQVWVIGRMKESNEFGTRKAQQAVVFPSFNPLSGGKPVNRSGEGLGPILKNRLMNLDDAEAFLLNGVNLGRIKRLRKFAFSEE